MPAIRTSEGILLKVIGQGQGHFKNIRYLKTLTYDLEQNFLGGADCWHREI